MGKTRNLIAAATLFIVWTAHIPAQRPAPSVRPSLSMDVNLVLLNATVTENSTEDSVLGLNKENFQVWEDKVEQTISYFSTEDIPVSVGIILDMSGSMKDKVASAGQAAATFFKSGTTEDEYFVIQFSDRPQVASDFTTDIRALQGRLLDIPAKGKTSLYDAVYLGLNKLKESHNEKKALLLITDGEDNHSRYSFGEIRESARERDVEIYAVGVLNPYSQVGRSALVQLTQLTGGRAFFPADRSDIETYCKTIATALKSQYVLGYHSTNTATDGAWRKVRVKVTSPKEGSARPQPLDVRARSGYYAPNTREQ